VHEEVVAARELEPQILPTSQDVLNALTGEPSLDLLRWLRASQPHVEDPDLLEPPARERRREPEANRLDLGKLPADASVSALRLLRSGRCAPAAVRT
jgi:hypothetical protein